MAQIVRGHGPGRGKKEGHDVPSFKDWIKNKLGWERKAADRAQQIGTLPKEELEKAFAESHQAGTETTFSELLIKACPYWYAASRKTKQFH